MKNKKYVTYGIIAVIAIALIVGVIYLVMQGTVNSALTSGKNGMYNPATGDCEPTEYTGSFFTCCYDAGKYQVDCDNPLVRLGPQLLAVYQTPPTYTSRAGVLSLQHGVTLKNDGNTFVSGWIQSMTATNKPVYAAGITSLNSAYAGIIGSAYQKPMNPGVQVSWSSGVITLDNLAPTGVFTPTRYDMNFVFTATNTSLGITGSDTVAIDFNVTKEFVQISGGVSLG